MKHQRKNLNITLGVGYFVVLIGMLSYRPFFVQFPITRDIPWVNMLMFVVGIGLMGGGLKRAFQRPDIYRGKVAGTIVAIAGVAGISYFFLRVYVAGLQKPIQESELEVFLLGWGPLVLDADMGLYGQFHSSVNPPKGLGSAFYDNPEYDKIMDTSRQEQNPKKRLEILKKASEMVWDDCPWIWLHVEKFVIAYSKKIKGMVVTNTEKFYPTYIKMEK